MHAAASTGQHLGYFYNVILSGETILARVGSEVRLKKFASVRQFLFAGENYTFHLLKNIFKINSHLGCVKPYHYYDGAVHTMNYYVLDIIAYLECKAKNATGMHNVLQYLKVVTHTQIALIKGQQDKLGTDDLIEVTRSSMEDYFILCSSADSFRRLQTPTPTKTPFASPTPIFPSPATTTATSPCDSPIADSPRGKLSGKKLANKIKPPAKKV